MVSESNVDNLTTIIACGRRAMEFNASIWLNNYFKQALYLSSYTTDLTEEGVTETDRHGLGLGIVGQGSLAKLAADSGLLVSTEWNLVVQHVVAVDPDGTGVNSIGNPNSGVKVAGVDSGSKTVSRVVASLNSVLNSIELGDGANWTKDLLLHDLHIWSDVGENGWLDEVSLITETLTTDLNLSALSLAVLNVLHDSVELDLGDLWALEGIILEWISDLVCVCALTETGNELVVDTSLDVDTGAGAAGLAVVEEDSEVDPGDGVVDISIIKDNIWGFASKLKSDLLQVGVSSGLHDETTDGGRSSESDLIDVHVGGEVGTGDAAESGDDVDDSWWETGLLDQVGGVESRKWSLLSSLQDNSVTAGNSWTNLPCPHEEWEVPWDDLSANTDL